jgi:hypothetical protein
MNSEDRLRIIAHLVDIGRQLNDMPDDDLSSVDHERLLHLIRVRDSLSRALKSAAQASAI